MPPLRSQASTTVPFQVLKKGVPMNNGMETTKPASKRTQTKLNRTKTNKTKIIRRRITDLLKTQRCNCLFQATYVTITGLD